MLREYVGRWLDRTSQESNIFYEMRDGTQRNIVTNYYCFLTHYAKMLHISTLCVVGIVYSILKWFSQSLQFC